MKKYNLDDSWKGIDNIAVYGFGKTAAGSIDKFVDNCRIEVIIDNDDKFYGQSYRRIPIKTFDEFQGIAEYDGLKIVLLVSGKARQSVKKSLDEAGYKDGIDYTDLDTFSTEWYFRFAGKFNIGKIGASITNRCTFRCKGCNMLMPYYKKPKDYPLEMLTSDVDLLFSLVDEISCFSVIGGEPLLHPETGGYIKYIGENYGARIGNLQLITNGSIMPDDNLLKILAAFHVEVRLSDYTDTIPYDNKYAEVKTAFIQGGVNLIEFKQTEWIDFGFPEEKISMGETSEELRRHMLNCHGMCHWLHDGKIFYCSNAWSASETGLIELNAGQDYVDISTMIKAGQSGRERFYEFYLGNMEKGYMSHCKRCRGFASECVMNAGVQMKVR